MLHHDERSGMGLDTMVLENVGRDVQLSRDIPSMNRG